MITTLQSNKKKRIMILKKLFSIIFIICLTLSCFLCGTSIVVYKDKEKEF